MKRNEGFTLIELLVVIAIIAILAAILFPVFAQVREKARQTACASNEKQIGLAIIQYTEDYDETYPNGTYWQTINTAGQTIAPVANGNGQGSGWIGAVYGYIKSPLVFTCPDDPSADAFTNANYVTPSYAINSNLTGYGNESDAAAHNNTFFSGGAAIAQLNSPTQTVMVSEVNSCDQNTFEPLQPGETGSTANQGLPWTGGTPANDFWGGCTNPDYGNLGGIPNGNRPRHGGNTVSNFLFADGHVKALNQGAVSPGYNAPTATTDESSSASNENGPTATAAGTGFTGTSHITGGSFAGTFSAI